MSALPFQPNHSDVLTAGFYLYRQQTNHKVHLLTGNDARAMIKLCLEEAKSPLAILKFLWGFTESHSFGRVALFAQHANILLKEYEKIIPSADFSGVIHVIVPHVIDRWNLIPHSLIQCYHYDGPHVEPPMNLAALVNRIPSKQLPGFSFAQLGFYEEGTLDQCAICTEPVNIKAMTCLCLMCNHVFHFTCVQQWVKARDSNLPVECPLCRQEFASQNDTLDLCRNNKFTIFKFQTSAADRF